MNHLSLYYAVTQKKFTYSFVTCRTTSVLTLLLPLAGVVLGGGGGVYSQLFTVFTNINTRTTFSCNMTFFQIKASVVAGWNSKKAFCVSKNTRKSTTENVYVHMCGHSHVNVCVCE